MPRVARPTTLLALAAREPAPAETTAPSPPQKRAQPGVDRSRPANEILSLNALLRDNAQLRRQLHAARSENAALGAEKTRETARLGLRITELRLELAGHQAAAARLTGRLHSLQECLPELRERQSLARRASDAEARASALSARLAEQESSAEQWRRRYLQLLEQRAPGGETMHPADGAPLTGKCILCIGRQVGALAAYRRIVENSGGRFLHQPIEQLEDGSSIGTSLAGADLVVCQADGISSERYAQLREHCRQNGTQCVFLQEPALASFGRIVSAVCAPTERITLR